VVQKGRITIDGASLTVIDVDDDLGTFSVSLIPHTLENITLGRKKAGDFVNIETDLFGKYVEKILKFEEMENGKKEEKSEIREILSNLFKENKRITAIICFIDYLENLGFSFNVINSIDEENGLIYGDIEDAIRNPKVVAVRSPNKKHTFYIGIKDFLSFISLRSTNNINDFINYLEVYHLDRSDTGYDDEEIERMEKIFKKVPLKKPSIFKEIIEKLNEKTKNK